jgi:hypothetical protein
MRPSRLLPNHSAVIAGANGIRYSALFDKSRVGPEVVLYQRFSGGHDDGDVGDTGSDDFAQLVSGNISFGMAFVNGSSREPRPAAGITALRIVVAIVSSFLARAAAGAC